MRRARGLATALATVVLLTSAGCGRDYRNVSGLPGINTALFSVNPRANSIKNLDAFPVVDDVIGFRPWVGVGYLDGVITLVTFGSSSCPLIPIQAQMSQTAETQNALIQIVLDAEGDPCTADFTDNISQVTLLNQDVPSQIHLAVGILDRTAADDGFIGAEFDVGLTNGDLRWIQRTETGFKIYPDDTVPRQS